MLTLLEHLPNELIFDVFEYVDTHDLYYGFWGLNNRFDDIIRSLKNFSLVIERDDPELIALFAPRIVRLVVNTWHEIDLRQVSNLRTLILHRTTRVQVAQIRPEAVPRLTYLSLSLAFDFWSSTQLAQDVFSNGFPQLRHADLGRVDVSYTRSWSLSPHLHSVCVCSNDLVIVPLILVSCPRLRRLQVQVFGDNHRIDLPSLRLNHSLKRFVFIDSYGEVSLNDIDLLLNYVPNLTRVELTLFELPFARLAQILARRLRRLEQFDCYITEPPADEHSGLDRIRAMHPYFEHLQCVEKRFGVRHFTNRRDFMAV